MSEEEENKRVSLQVSSLSTQLIESIEKQSQLEQKLLHAERENQQLRAQLKETEGLQLTNQNLIQQNKELTTRVEGLSKRLEIEIKEKLAAKDNVSKLEKETEELSASLFEEANVMVSQARQGEHAIKLKNDSLIQQLKEKDIVIESLQNQLRVLKDVLHERDRDLDEAASKRNSIIGMPLSPQSPTPSGSSLKPVLYSPTIDAIRYDLKMFAEFQKFIVSIKNYETIREADTKFIKRLLQDDVEPALRLDLAPSISWLNKRPTLSAIIDGRVSIQPVSGINETYRLNFQNDKAPSTDTRSNLYSYPKDSPPVALQEPCALCGEDRKGILEHERLYQMKIHAKQDPNNLSPGAPIITHQYPLCSYCLFRLRSVCELFAFLRSLKTTNWKLEDKVVQQKAWAEFARLRAKLFWARVGIWDVDHNIVTTKITPSTDDTVYKSIAVSAAPTARMSMLGGSAESLADSKGNDSTGYKSSPLINQIQESPQKSIAIDEADLGTVSVVTPQELKFPRGDKNDSDEDDVSDIIGDYSHDEAEEEEEEPETTLTEKVNGLHLKTDQEDRVQDDLLDSVQTTPVIGRNTSTMNTPTAEGGFDFEKQATPTKKETKATDGETEGTEEKTETEKTETEKTEKTGQLTRTSEEVAQSATTSDDEADFVDA